MKQAEGGKPPGAQRSSLRPPACAPAGAGLKVLIADDKERNRKALRDALSTYGHEVVEAADGVEALEKLRAGKFDAVVSDALMPRMDGYRLSYEVRRNEKLRNTRIIIYSATSPSPEDRRLALKVGADHFLQEPLAPDLILQALKDVTLAPRDPPEVVPPVAELGALKEYSEELVRRLEDANLRLEASRKGLLRANEEILKREEQVSLLLDSTAEGIYGLDLSGNITFCNAASLAMLGYSSAAGLLGKDAHALVHHTHADGTAGPQDECGMILAFRKGVRSHVDDEILWRADGTSFSTEYWSYPVRKNGRLVGSVVTFLDVTERRRAEGAIRASEQRIRALMENANDAIVVTSTEGIILETNRAADELYGRSRVDTLGTHFCETHVPEERERVREIFGTVLRQGSVQGFESLALRGDGRRVPVELSVAQVEIGEECLLLAIIRDVSERRLLEDQVRHAQKMEAIGRLAGGVAHDFNNLLTVILGYSDFVRAQLSPDNPLLSDVEEIRKAGERAAGLTRQLLAFSRTQVLVPELLDVNTVVTDTNRMLRRVIGEDVDLRTVCDPAAGRVRADRDQLEQVLMNLAVNARDAMPGGGSLTIETHGMEFDEAYAEEHVGEQPGPYVMLAVSDTGVGIDVETKARIFEPFFTTKETGKGTGLGLATVYGIVKQSGGFIWVYSEPGRGTTFKIYLPRVEGEPGGDFPRIAVPAPKSTRGTETLLLLEDESALRRLARDVLRKQGYTVLETLGWQSALEIAARHPGPIHLVLTDVVMPEMGGPEVDSRISALRPGIKVLYMSGYTSEAAVHRGLLEARLALLQKPFTPGDLARRVRELLDAS